MKQRPRIYYTEEQKSLMWDRWQKGESLHEIARLFDRHHPSIQIGFTLSRARTQIQIMMIRCPCKSSKKQQTF